MYIAAGSLSGAGRQTNLRKGVLLKAVFASDLKKLLAVGPRRHMGFFRLYF